MAAPQESVVLKKVVAAIAATLATAAFGLAFAQAPVPHPAAPQSAALSEDIGDSPGAGAELH